MSLNYPDNLTSFHGTAAQRYADLGVAAGQTAALLAPKDRLDKLEAKMRLLVCFLVEQGIDLPQELMEELAWT